MDFSRSVGSHMDRPSFFHSSVNPNMIGPGMQIPSMQEAPLPSPLDGYTATASGPRHWHGLPQFGYYDVRLPVFFCSLLLIRAGSLLMILDQSLRTTNTLTSNPLAPRNLNFRRPDPLELQSMKSVVDPLTLLLSQLLARTLPEDALL